jgi:hypothetical protein
MGYGFISNVIEYVSAHILRACADEELADVRTRMSDLNSDSGFNAARS